MVHVQQGRIHNMDNPSYTVEDVEALDPQETLWEAQVSQFLSLTNPEESTDSKLELT
jgi:hypothetical protein